MKKKTWALLGIVLFVFSSFIFTGFNINEFIDSAITGLAVSSNDVRTSIEQSGEFRLYFCPQDNCDDVLLEFLDTAAEQVYCALYEIDYESVNNKLLSLETDPSIDFKVVSDNTYLEDFDHPFVVWDGWGFMHNKFCVIDGEKVFTGSMNPTENGAEHNNNNIMIIESKAIAHNYLDEFEELYAGEFKKGERVTQENFILLDDTYGEIGITNLFCPEDDCALNVKEILEEAERSIHFMTFSFTHDGIENVLLIKHDEGKEVKGVLEARSATQYSPWDVFNYQGIEIYKDANGKTMHHKVFIIDSEIVVTGSFNPTASGDKRNDENVLIISNKEIASLFEEEFDKVFGQAKEKASLS